MKYLQRIQKTLIDEFLEHGEFLSQIRMHWDMEVYDVHKVAGRDTLEYNKVRAKDMAEQAAQDVRVALMLVFNIDKEELDINPIRILA